MFFIVDVLVVVVAAAVVVIDVLPAERWSEGCNDVDALVFNCDVLILQRKIARNYSARQAYVLTLYGNYHIQKNHFLFSH